MVVFSLGTGRVVYASEQASSILNCKQRVLESAKFVELLYHQDVNVFYSHTAQPHLPPWNMGTDSSKQRAGGQWGYLRGLHGSNQTCNKLGYSTGGREEQGGRGRDWG